MGRLEMGMEALSLLASLKAASNNNKAPQGTMGAPTKGFLVSLVEMAIRYWEESGGSMKDESELLETMFSAPTLVSKKLSKAEQEKFSSVIKFMTKPEQKVFRIALMILNPEEVTVKTAEVKKDGKTVSPAQERREKNGVDHRINVMRGIAAHVNKDLSNAEDVAIMLRDAGSLGGNNESLKLLGKAQHVVTKTLSYICGVDSINDITLAKLRERATAVLGVIPPVPDNTLPGPRVSLLMRIGRRLTLGSHANQPEEALAWKVIGVIVVLLLFGALPFGLLITNDHFKQKALEGLEIYQPTTESADTPSR